MAKGFKTGGRKKGTTNVLARKNRELMHQLLMEQLMGFKIREQMAKLQGKEYLDYVLKIASLVIPKPVAGELEEPEPQEQVKQAPETTVSPIAAGEEVSDSNATYADDDDDEIPLTELLYLGENTDYLTQKTEFLDMEKVFAEREKEKELEQQQKQQGIKFERL